jgi:hypothetical protein
MRPDSRRALLSNLSRGSLYGLVLATLAGRWAVGASAPPASFDVGGRTPLLVVHAEGAQLYECKPTAGGGAWTFREPIAALIKDGKTIGRHYAGPTWELDDGGAVKGKVAATAPGATAADIPMLKLDVVEHRGAGVLKGAALVVRLDTHGGVLTGACPVAGQFRAVPYAADYAFLP